MDREKTVSPNHCSSLLLFGLAFLVTGCTTTHSSNTSRTGLEQLLISNAVDQAISHYDFHGLRDTAVFVDEGYLDGVVDRGYIAGSVRHRVLSSGGRLVASREDANVVLEIRSGGVGTDLTESYVGMPGVALPGPMPVELPEVRLWNRNSQLGTAKLGIVAYDAKEGHPLDIGGLSLARSDDNNWFVMGVGPFQSGTVRDEVHLATGQDDSDQSLTQAAIAVGALPQPGQRR